MRNTLLALLIAALLGIAPMANAVDTLWRIGVNDNSYRDLADGGNYQECAKRFAQDITYVVGKNTPRADWPFIHPGDQDDWAGMKEHPINIQFNLKKAPKDACRLSIFLLEIHPSNQPGITVRINDHDYPLIELAPGVSEAALTNADAGHPSVQSIIFPGSWLRRGQNMIRLSALEGSWIIYDALALESGIPNTPMIEGMEVYNTPLFRKVDGVMKQAVRVEIENVGLEGPAKLRLEGVNGVEQDVTLKQGDNTCFIMATPFTEPDKRRVVAEAGGKSETRTFDAKPERFWKLFVAASAHTDIGYTDLQEKCMALHVDNTIAGIDAAAAQPDFKYNLEVFAQADWFKELKPNDVARLEKGIRDKQIGLTGLYLNMLTCLCTGEEMMWLLRPAQMYSRSLGVPTEMASLNDVPSATGTLPMFLRHAGIRYFSDAINEDRGPSFLHAEPDMIQSPFWWEGFDGSRVLAIFTRTYFQTKQIKLDTSVAAMTETLPGFLNKFIRNDYPGDAIFINGAFLDNCAMTTQYGEVAREWNSLWESPKVILSTPDEYFRYVEDNFGNDLPVYHGDMGAFWEDGAASSSLETEMVRWAKAGVSTAEKWQALAALRQPGKTTQADYESAWRDILYYDEHTWGSAASIGDPNGAQTLGQWTRKATYAINSQEKGRTLEKTLGFDALCDLAKAPKNDNGRDVLVSNSLSWERDIVVILPAGAKAGSVRDQATNRSIPAQKTADGGLVFVAEKVPAMGYRRFNLESSGDTSAKALLTRDGDDYSWKSDRYSFHIDPKTGGLDRITETATGKQWVDSASGFSLNQFLYVKGGEGTAMIHPGAKPATDLKESTHEAAAVTLTENGAARAVIHIARTGANISAVDTDLVIHRDGTLDVVNILHKIETLEKEAGYFVFPFGLNAPDAASAYIELPYGIVQADQEQMPGACREWYAANTFAATGAGGQSAYLAAPDTPMFTVGDINRGLWPNRVKGHRNVLYGYVFNNYWHTNYKASQGGDIRCAFSVKLSDAPYDPVAATRFGWARTLDMTPGRSCAVRTAAQPGPASRSFLTLDDGPVVLGDMMPCDEGVLARFYNPSNMDAATSLNLDGARAGQMLQTDLFGQKGVPLAKGAKVQVPARGITTILIKTK